MVTSTRERSRSHEASGETEAEHQRLSALYSLHLLDTPPEERFDRLTRLARRLFDVPVALVTLVDQDRLWFKSTEGLDRVETPRDRSLCSQAILGEDLMVVEDASEDRRFADNPLVLGPPNIRFYAGMPLRVGHGMPVGTLCIMDEQSRTLVQEDRETLIDLARIAEQELVAMHLAGMDDLTQLSNRRGFKTLAQHAMNVCRRQERPAALFFFDLDQFKPINDQFGHAEGDAALTRFARVLKTTFRDSDVIGRLGGDEFVVFLTGFDLEESTAVQHRFSEALDEENRRADRGYELLFSVGIVAMDPDRHHHVDDLLADADQQMYRHKGRHLSGYDEDD